MNFKEVVTTPKVEPSKSQRQKQTSLAEQKRIVGLWLSSGLTPPQFCQQHNLSPKNFYRWRKNNISMVKSSKHADSDFKIKQTIQFSTIKILLPNHIQLSLNVDVDNCDGMISMIKELASWNCN